MTETEAKRKAGRPRIMPKGSKRLTVSLGVDDYAVAERIGEGNVSEGIRRALLQVGTGLQGQTPDKPI